MASRALLKTATATAAAPHCCFKTPSPPTGAHVLPGYSSARPVDCTTSHSDAPVRTARTVLKVGRVAYLVRQPHTCPILRLARACILLERPAPQLTSLDQARHCHSETHIPSAHLHLHPDAPAGLP
ncbi:hypothetical protein BDW02DRAFT_380694 [Decorospora gaudefroyi]|uniref:Uncharacterized protein n=1 Tax=Decorospora gaudefroyi TaxID=184978 RepID=A0A6A5KG69_9PLEO|nr:hypothetical protein BDW02DRAFT_380694 [Decorospora gaudefroyi]